MKKSQQLTGTFTFETKDAVTNKTVNVKDITLDGNWNTNYTLDNKELVLTDGIITAKEVIPVLTAEDKTYDGNRIATGTISLDGIIDGDDITAVALSYTFDTKDSGAAKTVTSSEITLSGEDSSNYVLSSTTATTTATITKVKLTPIVTVDSKVYDGTIDATGNINLEGAVNEENPTAIATFMFEDKDVGTGKQVIVTNITLGNTWSTNYELTKESDTKTANITKATLKATYVGETVLFGRYPRLEINITGFVNGENETTAEEYEEPTISNLNTQVGSYELTPYGGSAKNYDFTYESGTLVIEPNKSNVTVSLDNREYTYTGEEHRPQVTAGVEETTLIEGQDYDVTYINNIDAGTATVKITLKGNYAGTVTENFIINKAEGTAQVTIEGWTYGESAKSPIVTSTTNDVNNVTYTYYIDEQCTTKTTSVNGATEIGGKPVNSGKYYVKATIGESKNYKEVQVATSFEIKKAILTPTALLDSKTYDGTVDGTGKITFTDAVNNELPTATAIFTYTDAISGTGKTVNVTDIELDSDWNINYELSKNSITLTNGVINKAILTASYNSETIYYGEEPKLEVIITGFVNNETEDVIETKPILKNVNTKVGTYTLTPEGGSATNYSFNIVSGTLTINKKSIQDLNVSLDKSVFTYDGIEKEPVVTILYGETTLVKDIDYTVSYTSNINVGTANVVITGIGNYEGIITKEFTIQKANMSVEVTNYNGTYDGKSHTITLQTTPSNNTSIYYSTNTELTNSNYLADGNTSIPSRTSVGTDAVYYYIHDTSGNYNDYSSSANNKNGKIQINAKTMISEDITAKLDESTFTYSGKAKEPTPLIKDGDTTLINGTDYTVRYEDNINAGTAKVIITGTGNYSGELELTFTINKKKLTPEVIVEDKIYDGTDTASCEILLTGIVDGEDVTVTYSSSKFSNSTVGTGKTVTIKGIILHGEDSVNYELEDAPIITKANITPKELTATYVSETIEYGETPRLEVTVTGFVGSETAQTAEGYTAPEVNNTNIAIGEYELTPANGTATNYSFKYVSGTLTINARSNVTVTLSQTSYTYDGTAKTPEVTVKNDKGETVSIDNYTVTYANNINAGKATVKVSLKGNYSGTVSEIFTINKASRTITVEDTIYVGKGTNKDLTFTYTGISDVTATATSNATATATVVMTDVNKGGTVKITGVEAGTGKVTITVPEDTNYNKATKTINVTVTDFTIAPTTGTIAKGGTITITPEITPASIVNTDAATTISWKSGNTSVATVSNSSTTKGAQITVTGVANGTATITATLNGQSKTAKITVNSVASTTIGDKTTYYTTVQNAIDAAGINQATVKLLYNGSRTEAITVKKGQNITLNTNGATLTSGLITITNEGILTVNGSGEITGSSAIENRENGQVIISDVTMETTGPSIKNYSNLKAEGAPAVKIISGKMKSRYRHTIVNYQDVTGLIVINGGYISSEQTEENPTVLNYAGTIIIDGAEITSSKTRAVCQYEDSRGVIEIRSGKISGPKGVEANNGQVIITGGEIIGTEGYGAFASGTGILTIGTKEIPEVSTTTPSITGKTEGVMLEYTGKLNFYDGIITGPTEKSIYGPVTETPDGYVVVKGSKIVDGIEYETSVLGPSLPVITAKLNDASGATYTSGKWTNKNVYVTLASSNVGAGIKEYQWKSGDSGTWSTSSITSSGNTGTITFKVDRNSTVYFRAIDNSGVISEESSIIIRRETTLPTITVSPTSATACKTKNVTITVKDEGGSVLSSSNSYQYYLSSSSTTLSNGEWKNYTSGTSFTIGTGITGTRYLFVKRVSDNAGNVSKSNGTEQEVSGVKYQRFGSYVFDNTKPTAIINTESMYVTDGLVTRLDGVNNNGGSHSSSETTWKDLSGNGKNGTIANGTWGANYLEFNGTSSWVNLGVMNSDYQTLEATFSLDTVPTVAQYIIGNWENGGGGISTNSSGYIAGQYYIGSSYRSITSKVKVAANQKYHVALTYDGSNVILYINGVEQGKNSSSGTIGVPENSTIMALGTNPGGTDGITATGSYLDGKIYTAAVYNKALTSEQVKTNADAGKALAGGPTNASSITYTIRFNETVTGFTTDDVTVTNGTKGSFTEITDGRVYRVVATTSANQNNTQTIALVANGCTDTAGNGIATTNKTVVIDRVAPTVTLSTNGGTYNITPGNTTISVSTTLAASDTGSGIAGLSYAWGESNSIQPSTWTEFTSGTQIAKSLSGGNNYLWTNVIDNAGNRATSIKTSSVFTVKYQVVFNANSGTGAPSTQNKEHDTALTLSKTKPTKTGYTFKEWNTKADGKGTGYASGASYTANSATTLYAIWEAKKVEVTFMRNTTSTDTTNNKQTFTYDVSGQSFSAKEWSKTGYTLAGWSTDKNATKATWSVTSKVNNTWINENSPQITLYAVWTANNYTITYNYNGTKNYIEPNAATISCTGFTGISNKSFNLGKLYVGDLTESDELTISFDVSYSGLTAASGQTASAYCQGSGNVTGWSPSLGNGARQKWIGTGTASYSYTVTMSADKITNEYFNVNLRTDYYSGGTITISNIKAVRTTTETKSLTYGTALGTLPTPSETGYTLKGWYTAKTGGTKISATTTVPAADTTYYAQWTANELTFSNQSKSSYYDTVAKTVSITGASNGTGTYTYNISSQKNSAETAVTYFTISGTTITVKANTPVGTYKVVVKATDSNSKKTKEATITITVEYLVFRDKYNSSYGPLYYVAQDYQTKITGSFSRNRSLTEAQVKAKEAIRLDREYDNPDAEYKIYGWIEEGTEENNFYWWSNVGVVAMTEGSGNLFRNMSNVKSIDTTDINTSTLRSMSDMFYKCKSLTNLDLSNFDTSSVTSMSYMFNQCTNLTNLDIGNFDTSSVKDMSYMFNQCTNLTNLDIGNFDTSSVKNMSYMFRYDNSLTNLDLSNFDTSSVTNMGYMVSECHHLTNLDLSNFDTSSVTTMERMFEGCNSLTNLDLSNFDTSSVTNMSYMFDNCRKLETIYVSNKFNTDNVTSSPMMFNSCYLLVGGNGTTYTNLYYDKTYARIDKPGQPGYFTEKTASTASLNNNATVTQANSKSNNTTLAMTMNESSDTNIQSMGSLQTFSMLRSIRSRSLGNINNATSEDEEQEYSYKIEHYYQDKQTKEYVIDSELTDTKTARCEDVINMTEQDKKVKDGYAYEKSDKDSITISENLDENVIKLYYKIDKYEYSVHYFYDGIEDKEKCVKNSSKLGSKIVKYEDKVIPGYKLQKVEPLTKSGEFELTIQEDEEKNVINVYYEKDMFEYTVHYFYDGVENKDEKVTLNTEFGSKVKTYQDKNITGYKLEKFEPVNEDGNLELAVTEKQENNNINVYYEKDMFEYTVHYFYDGIENEDKMVKDKALFGTKITKYEDKAMEKYTLDTLNPVDKNGALELTITENSENNTINVYYNTQYNITAEVLEHTENYKDGNTKEKVKGGSIYFANNSTKEVVCKGKMPQNSIKIIPNKTQIEEYEISKVIIKNGKEDKEGIQVDLSLILNKDGTAELPVEFLVDKAIGMQSDKHIEVEFRKKTKVIVRHLEKETEKVLYKTEDGKDYEEINGYEGMHFETNRRLITNHQASSLLITNENKQQIKSDKRLDTDEKMYVNGQMYADTLTIIYWYEKIQTGMIVKHIEIDEQDKKNGLTLDSGIVLDEEIINGQNGLKKTTQRKVYNATKEESINDKYKNYISATTPQNNNEDIVIASEKDKQKDVIYSSDKIVEVRYYYEKQYNLTTKIKTHKENINGVDTNVKGGEIIGEELNPYEVILEHGSNKKSMEINPDAGYRVKSLEVNGKVLNTKDFEKENHKLVLESGYFKDVQEDINVVVEFEKIPAKVIVKYQDIDTKEDIASNKVITGIINDEYNIEKIELPGYSTVGEEPKNSKGKMTEEQTVVTYWYTKQFKIITNIIEHEEKIETYENSEGSKEKSKTTLAKGGKISGEDLNPYEIVSRGKSNSKEIVITPDIGYRIKDVTINGKSIEIKDLVKEDKSACLKVFENIQEDKVINVEFEKIPSKVIIKHLEEKTEKMVSVQEIIQGNVNDKYTTKEKELDYYEVIKEKYPENNEGLITEDEITVIYYYRKNAFNLKIENEIEKIVLNGQNVTDNNKAKVEIKYKDINEVNLEICYKIKVTNTGELEGKAVVEQILPSNFEFAKDESNNNQEKDNEEKSDEKFEKKNGKYLLETDIIKPQGTKEYKVYLRWIPNEEERDEAISTVKIIKSINDANYKESSIDDNESKVAVKIKLKKQVSQVIEDIIEDVVNMPKTGQSRIIYISAIIIAGVSIGLMVWRKIEK